MTIRSKSFAFLIYVIIGVVVAWNRDYIDFAWLKARLAFCSPFSCGG